MSRKQFIEAQGATCKNWNWSWSFINEKEKTIIFGAWDFAEKGDMVLIFTPEWQYDDHDRKRSGYDQSLEHIRLIEEEGYQLKTFPIYHSDDNKDEAGLGPAKIGGFKKELAHRALIRIGNEYYASSKDGVNNIPEEVPEPDGYPEGASSRISVNVYERNRDARTKCIEHFGYTCQVCEFDFGATYGQLGKDYIHVHHLVPLSEIKASYQVNPITDLIPVCPNCHAMIHRTRPALSVATVRNTLQKTNATT